MKVRKKTEPFEWLSSDLEAAVNKLGAHSATFYVRDPLWPDELQLVGMHGVVHKEPMYGFAWPYSARKVVLEGEDAVFSTDASRDFSIYKLRFQDITKDKRKLFNDFIGREEIVSTARLIHRGSKDTAGKTEAVLFVNYKVKTEFTQSLKARITKVFKSLVAQSSDLRTKLLRADSAITWPFISNLVSPVWSLANVDFQSMGSLEKYFRSIMESALGSLKISMEKSIGTIHIYDPENERLSLASSCGREITENDAAIQLVNLGDGIGSWVVHCKRALLIRDVMASPFKVLHKEVNSGIVSELAVPLTIEGEVLGVLCLGSTMSGAFRPEHVRLIWYAANKAALAHKLHKYGQMSKKLLELSSEATGAPSDQTAYRLSGLIANFARASFCDIWKIDRQNRKFDYWTASYPDFSPSVRENGGWSRFVVESGTPVWISEIKSTTEYNVLFWRREEWTHEPTEHPCPLLLNQAPINQHVWGELGLPILVKKDCIGVIWVKYRQPNVQAPGAQTMSMMRGLSSQAGLVMESMRLRDEIIPLQKSIDDAAESIAERLKKSWQISQGIIDAYGETLPYEAFLGGDFSSGRVLEDGSVGIMLLDATYHGLGGALRMLPLRATYENYWNTESTLYLMGRLRKTATQMGATAEAIYCIVSDIEGKTWMSVTSAGLSSSMLLFQPNNRGDGWQIPKSLPRADSAGNGPMLTEILRDPLGQDSIELRTNDVLVAYTDGLYGELDRGRAVELVRRALPKTFRDLSAKQIVSEILRTAKELQGGSFSDDVTVFAVVVGSIVH